MPWLRARRKRIAGPLALAAGAGCGTTAGEAAPRPPDLDPIIAEYERPSAAFDPNGALAVSEAAQAIAGQLAALAIESELDALWNAFASSEVDSTLQSALEGSGFVRVTRICPGWLATPVANAEANGRQVLTARFTQAGLEPTVWGDVRRCRYRFEDTQIQIDTDGSEDFSLALHHDSDASGEADAGGLLVVLRLHATVDGESSDLSTDFRILDDGLEYRLERDDGSMIARWDAGGWLSLRATNGEFSCDEALACQRRGETGP